MAIQAVTYKCDRDGTEAPGAAPSPGMVPAGWVSLNAGGTGVTPINAHLCPACAAGLVSYMNASGGKFSLTPPAAPAPAPPPGPA